MNQTSAPLEPESPNHGRAGILVGAVLGLFGARWMLMGAVNPDVVDHEPLYGVALLLNIGAAAGAFAISLFLGWTIGRAWKK